MHPEQVTINSQLIIDGVSPDVLDHVIQNGKDLAKEVNAITKEHGFKVAVLRSYTRSKIVLKCSLGGEFVHKPNQVNRSGKKLNRPSKLTGCTWELLAVWKFGKGFVVENVTGFHNHDKNGNKLELVDDVEIGLLPGAVIAYNEAEGDGKCGYRSIAWAAHKDQERHKEVKEGMLKALDEVAWLYKDENDVVKPGEKKATEDAQYRLTSSSAWMNAVTCGQLASECCCNLNKLFISPLS